MRLGTRGSALALWQAKMVAGRLRDAGHDAEIVIIKTTGDARQDVPLPELAGKGVFVREIELALARGDIDLAVHSAKDMPSVDPDGLSIAAFCERADPRDALIAPKYGELTKLPKGARVATGSPRRVAQLRALRRDLQFVEIRGNVDTRLAKLAQGDADALVLAVAGLTRLGRADAITQILPTDICLPQVGQGCVAVQCRNDDAATRGAVAAACDHTLTRVCVTAERAFLARLGGGCTAPVGAFAGPLPGKVGIFRLEAMVADLAGSVVRRGVIDFTPEGTASSVAELYDMVGGNELSQVSLR